MKITRQWLGTVSDKNIAGRRDSEDFLSEGKIKGIAEVGTSRLRLGVRKFRIS
jgi:hypothetical protein